MNPIDHVSLFAAAGISLGTDIKTITASTLFERLRHVAKGFDEKVKTFCDDLAKRRNAELHSGEIPFKEMKLSVWEGLYWRAAQIVLDRMDTSLDEWLGAAQAKAPKEIVEHARRATVEAALVRIEEAKARFSKRPKKDREAAIRTASTGGVYGPAVRMNVIADERWSVRCPACGAEAVLAGVQFHEHVIEEHRGYEEEDPGTELVEKLYSSEEFFCPTCELRLDGQGEIEAAELELEHAEVDERERRYEEEYNNE